MWACLGLRKIPVALGGLLHCTAAHRSVCQKIELQRQVVQYMHRRSKTSSASVSRMAVHSADVKGSYLAKKLAEDLRLATLALLQAV